MTPDPYTRLLAKMAAEAEPTFLDLRSDRSEWWEARAKSYARIADSMLKEWREMYAKAHPRPIHYDGTDGGE